jgi:transcriptional regulator with PAS, ATPase and Fis domain
VGWRRAEEENVQLKRALKQRYNFENIVGKSEPMLKIFDLVAQVANSRSTVLVAGREWNWQGDHRQSTASEFAAP